MKAPKADAATAEAFSWRLFDPAGPVATATFHMYDESLRVQYGAGYFRNDNPADGYNEQEWIFVDLRVEAGLRLGGRTAKADELLGWVTAQALKNRGMIAELFDRRTGTYKGSVPMAGFGAGAYLLSTWLRDDPAGFPALCE